MNTHYAPSPGDSGEIPGIEGEADKTSEIQGKGGSVDAVHQGYDLSPGGGSEEPGNSPLHDGDTAPAVGEGHCGDSQRGCWRPTQLACVCACVRCGSFTEITPAEIAADLAPWPTSRKCRAPKSWVSEAALNLLMAGLS